MLWFTVLYVPHDKRTVVFIPAEDTDYQAARIMPPKLRCASLMSAELPIR